jgi:uncharacterized repeat protein (TIGR02059 family)
MASETELRQHIVPPPGAAEATNTGRLPLASILFALVLAALSGTLLVASQLAKHRDAQEAQPTFLTKALGAPQPSAPLARQPSDTQHVRFDAHGFSYTHGTDAISLASVDAGSAKWRRYSKGVTRRTNFGSEAITMTPAGGEEFLTVEKSQGLKTWRWRLGTKLKPKLRVDGTVELFDAAGLSTGVRVSPVAILDRSGDDITPKGLSWSLSGRTLELRLDDRNLPSPYVIDPAVSFRQISAVATTNGATTLSIARPTGTVSGDVMLAQISTLNNFAVTATGWTTIARTPNGASSQLATLYKVNTGEAGPYSFTIGATNVRAAGAIQSFASADNNAPVDAFAAATNTGTGVTWPNVTPVQTGTDTVVGAGAGTGITYTAVTGVTGRGSGRSGNGNGNTAIGVGDAGNNTSMTATQSASALWEAHTIALSPTLEADGSGTLTVLSPTKLAASSTGNTITFRYTAASAQTGGMNNGAVTIVIPAGWSAPQVASGSTAGYTTATKGTVATSAQTITISSLSLAAGGTVDIVYGSTAVNVGGAATLSATTGAVTFTAQQKSWVNSYAGTSGTLTNLASSPSLTVYAPNGSGTLTSTTTNVSASSTRTIAFTYTAATGGTSGGAVSVDVPTGWTAPQTTTPTAAGYTTVTAGTVAVSGQTITVSNLTLAAAATLTITYGDTNGGANPGAAATVTSTTGAQTWQGAQNSIAGTGLVNLTGGSPSITVNGVNGSGTMSVSPTTVSASSTGQTLTYVYTAAAGGMANGSISIDIPAGWTAPQTASGSTAGYVTTTAGSPAVSGTGPWTITVSSLTLAAASTVTVKYGDTSVNAAGAATATATPGAATFAAKQVSVNSGALVALATSPSLTVYAADGSGTVSVTPTSTLAGTTNNTDTFTYTAAAGGMNSGSITIDVPANWTAPQTTINNAAGYTTTTSGTIAVSGSGPWTITVSNLTLAAAATVTVKYGDTSVSPSGAATAPTATGSSNWTTKQKSTSGGTLTDLAAQPSVTVNNAADGAGTVSISTSPVLAGTTQTETLTYTAPTGGMTNGALTIDVPAGWTAPQTGAGAGQVTSSVGSVSVAGQTITIDSLSRNAGQTVVVTYANGVAATTTGSANWTTKQKSTAGGTLTNLGAQPSVTVNNAADGTGTVSISNSPVLAGTTQTETLTYTAPTGGMTNGALTIDVPAGWTAPQTGAGGGQVSSSVGTVSVTGQTITVDSLNRNAGQTVVVTYSNGVVTTSTGTATWTTKQKATAAGTLTNLSAQPTVTVDNAADGSGTASLAPSPVLAGTTQTETLTYTAPTGGMTNGAIMIDVPTGWSAPQTGAGAGQVTSNVGTVSVAGQTITLSNLSRNAGQTVLVTYTNGVAATTAGSATWTTKQKSTSGGTLTDLAAQPAVTVNNAADGSGTVSISTSPVLAGTTQTETLTYTAPTGGMTNGALTIDVPAGWTAPQTGAGAGQVTSSVGSVSVAGQTITINSLSRNAGQTVVVTYANGVAATTTGSANWTTKQKSTAGGTLTNLGAQPSVTVDNAADGTGTLTTGTSSVLSASGGHTITFTYTAATGGTTSGSVTIDVPAGWSAPSTTGWAAGYTSSSNGAVSVAGQTITVDSLSLAAGATVTVTYGSTASGGSGAVASSSTGSQTWSATEKSTAGGTLTSLASSPSITVTNSADGSGTLTTPTSTVLAGSAGNSITFTYTAATGGMTSGGVKVVVPAGWTAPQTGAGAGQVTSSAGTVSVSGQTITVDSLTLAAGGTATITYANATATSTTGAQTWNGQQRSTGGGAYTALASSPSITVDNSPHGSGTLTTSTAAAERASIGNTITFTYTAATGGMSNGAVTLDVPAGWTAPQTGAGAGQVSSSAGSVSVAGGTVTVDSVSLAGGATFTITYAAGAAPSTTGAQTWSAKQKSSAGGTLTALASSPSIIVQDTIAPTFSSGTVDGSSLVVTFDETLDGGSTPAGSAFDVKVNGSSQAAPTNVSVSGSTATLTLAATVHSGDTVTVAYTQPGSSRLRDPAANDVSSFGAQSATNTTLGLNPDVPALTSPANAVTVGTATPTVAAQFTDTDTNDTGTLAFRVCSDSGCGTVLGTFSSASGVANGAAGSAAVPGGTITADGTYYWQAKATDQAGLASAFSSSRSFVVDTTAPTVQTAAVDGTSLTLTYGEPLDGTSTPANLDYALHANGGSGVAPTNVAVSGSTVTLTFPAGTVHNGDLVQLDYTAGTTPARDLVLNNAANFTNAAATNSTTSVDPDVPVLISPAGGVRVNATTPSLTAGFADSDTQNTGQLTFQLCSDSTCASVLATFSSASGIANGANGSASVPGGTVTTDGTYHWRAKATDNTTATSPYSATRSLVVDTTAPTFSSADVSGTTLMMTMNEPLDSASTPAASAFTVARNGTAMADPTNVSISGSTLTLTLAATVRNGDAVTVAYVQPGANRLRDIAGNDSASFGAQAAANSTPSLAPDVPALVSPADGTTLATLTPTLTAGFSDTDTNNTGRIDFRVCTSSGCGTVLSTFSSSSGIANGANGAASVPNGELTTDGTYYWQARATDDQGVSSAYSASRSFVADTTGPPVPSIDSGPGASSVSGPDVTFAFSDSEGGATFEVQIDGDGWTAATSPKAYAGLADGDHTFEVRAKDTLGNPSTPRTRTWTVDAVAPPVPAIDSGPAGGSTTGVNVSFGFSDSEPGVTFEVQLDGGGFAVTSSPNAYSGLGDGSHTFQVRAKDTYGNTSPAVSRTWTVDAVAAPAPAIDSGPGAGATSGPNVAFGFSDSEGGTTFEVRLDGGSWTADASPKSYVGLADGSHTFDVRALDPYGNPSSATARAWTVDAIAPPAPSIDSGPAGGSTSAANVAFSFSDSEGGTSFEVRLDGGAWTGATAPKSYAGLADGSHTFDVRALDAYGNLSSAAFRTWTVDAVAPPAPTIDSGPAGGSTSGPGVGFGFSDGEGGATFEIRLDGGVWTADSSPKSYAGLAEGSHTFEVRALDAYGNTSSATTRTWAVDATPPPVPTIDSGPAGGSTSGPDVVFGFSDSEGGATVEIRLDGGVWTAATSPKTYTGLTDGSHTLDVRALDGYGNTSGATSRTWTADATPPPVPTIDGGPAGGSTSGDGVSFQFSDSESGVNLECKLDGGAWTGCLSPRSLTGLADGSHTFQVRALDAFANTSGAVSRTWTVDAIAPPTPSIDSGPAGGSTSSPNVAFGFSDGEGGATFEIRLDGGGWTADNSPMSYAGLADGSHTFEVRALDAYGNASSIVGRTWTVDAIAPPAPSIDSGPAGGSTSGTGIAFGFSDGESGVTFEVQLDGGGWTTATSPKAYAGLSQGSHTFEVRAKDAYDNTSGTTTRTWDVDATPPTVSITSPLSGVNLSGTVTITSNANDAGGSGLASVTYEYRLSSGGSWTATAANWNTALLTDGDHDLRAVATDNAGNSTTSASITSLHLDNHPPTVTLAAPQYVNASAPASITLTATSPDTDLQDVTFWSCSNSSAGCSTGTWNLIAVDPTSPYSASWTVPGADGNAAVRAVATDNASNSGPDTANVLVDRTAPTAGSIDYTDGYAGGSLTISTANGNDGGGAGLDLASAQLQRDETALAADSCAPAFPGSWSAAASPDTTLQTAKCYRYRYRIADNAGNLRTYTSANVVKVDTTPPAAVTLAWSALNRAYQSGSTVYFKQGGAGGFTVTATSADPESGVQSTNYPSLGPGWTSGGTYTFDNTANAPGSSSTVTVTNNAGLSSTATFDVVSDSSAPAGGSIAYTDGYHTAANVDLTLDDGTDGGSGIDTASEILERSVGTLGGGSCTGFGAFAPLATDPALSYNDSAVASGDCYRYRYVVTDRVGNSATYTTANVVKIDSAAPSGSIADPGQYLRGVVNLTAAAGDTGGSGVDTVAFQRSTGGPWTTIDTDADGPPYAVAFDTTTASTPDGLYDVRVVITDGAGNQTMSAVVSSRRIDNTPPGATLNDPGQNLRATVNLTSSSGDGGSGIASTVYQYLQQPAGPWTTTPAAFDTTTGSTPDGLYDLRAIVTDNAGNTTTDTIANRRIDNTPPTATMDDPGQFLRGSVTFSSTSSDPGGSGVASVGYEKSPAGAGTYTPAAQPWATTAADDGAYDLRVHVTDNAGNTSDSLPVTNVLVDNTSPNVSVTSPVAGTQVTGSVSITISASDGGSGVDTSSIEYAHQGAGDWTATPAAWDTTLLTDGLYELRAKATDRAGNNATSAVVANVLVDNLAPTVSFTTPTAAQYMNAASADPRPLNAAASDAGSGVASVEFFSCTDTSTGCTSGTWTSLGAPDTTDPYDGSWPLPTDGNRAVKAVATDNVGRTASAVIDVTVDRTFPDTTVLTKPGDPSNVASPSFTFDSTEPGSTFECRLDAGTWTACTSPATIGPLADGPHTFDVRATDPAGNTDATEASWTWLVDLTPPNASLSDPGRNVRGPVALTSTQDDPGATASGVATVTYEYSTDGSSWASTPATWDTALVSDGVYQLHVVVTDNAGNATTSAAVTDVRVDNTPPTTSVDDPGSNLRQTVNITGSANDAGSGVTQVDLQISPAGANAWTTFGSANAAPYAAPLTTTSYADGLYDVRTVATDAAGNVTQGAPVVNRRIDNTPPTASISSPGSPLRGTVSLSATYGDPAGSGVATVVYEASRNGGAYAPIAQNWNTIASGDGSYSLQVVATDVAGNVTTSGAVGGIVVDNTAPTTTDNAPSGWQNAPVTVSLSANDAGSGISTTRYSVDGGGWQTGSSVNVPTADGSHTIAYYSVDVAGNVETQKSATILMQTTPPSCPSCSAADYLRGAATLTASPQTTAGGAPITSVAFKYQNSSGGPIVTIGTDVTAPYAISWSTTTVADGGYDLIYEVRDAANNVSQTNIGSKVVDNTAPTASVGSPTGGAVVSDTVTFGATATDANLANVEYFVNGSSVGSTSGGSVNWNTNTVADGNAGLYVVVTDRAGNSTTSAGITVVVDNDPPAVSMSAPPIASGVVTLGASASADTTSVEFQRRSLPGGSWTPFSTDLTPGYSADLDTATLPDGDYELRALATDQGNHTTTSSPVSTKIDNTAPTGTVATPSGGATVGGNVPLTANANDATSGVASVAYELRPTGGASFGSIGSAGSSPYGVFWNASSVASGSYDLRIAVTDRAGNVFRSAPITIFVDSTPPGVQLDDPGSVLSGTVTLRATTTGNGATRVVFAISAAGANSWTDIGTDGSEPWAAALDTTQHPDGPYDLRATVYDTVGNFQTSVRSNVLIDNQSPTLASSTPAEGSVVGAADSIVLVASESLAGVDGARLDGVPPAAPVMNGTRATFNTGALGAGAHTLTGTLRDPAGHTAPFAVHFTIQPAGGALNDPPAVETNTTDAGATTLGASDGTVVVTMPAGAWPTGAAEGDWVILKIDPVPGQPSGLASGLDPATKGVDVTARWALSGGQIHQFSQAIELVFPGAPAKALPVTDEGGWHVIQPLPGRTLPDSQPDGFFRDAAGIHVLTHHLTQFALVNDVQAPAAPTGLSGTFGEDGLTIHWQAGKDNSGLVGPATVYAGGQAIVTVAAGTNEAKVGKVDASDTRAFTIVQTDFVGGAGAPSRALRVLPDLTGLTPAAARSVLQARGFTVGNVTTGDAPGVQPGTIAQPRGLSAEVEGTAVDLVVAAGGPETKLAFNVVGTTRVTTSRGERVAARISVSKPASVTATLSDPRGRKLKSWKFSVKAGVTIKKLPLPGSVKPGVYKLTWVARSGVEQIKRTILVRVVRKGAAPATAARSVEILLVGAAPLRNGLASSLAGTRARVTAVSDEDTPFTLAGNASRNVQVIIVDVDEYSLSLVHDLRTVFPGVAVIALTADPEKLSAAVTAGASVALPLSSPPSQLARAVRRLTAI